MSSDHLQDVTSLFQQLQYELELAGTGANGSFDEHLKIVAEDLTPFFSNPSSFLSVLGLGALGYEHAFIKRTENWSKPYILKILSEYLKSKEINLEETRYQFALYALHADESFRHMAHIAQLQSSISDIKKEAWVRSCFRDIGDVIEAGVVPFSKLRLKIQKISEGNITAAKEIDSYDSGKILSALSLGDPSLYKPDPFNILLSQWRNISHHSSYKIQNNKIVCQYGKKPHTKTLECTKQDLLNVLKHAQDVFYIHRVAYEIFVIDNYEHISPIMDEQGTSIKITELTLFSSMVLGIVASGFHIEKAAYREFRWALVLFDKFDREESKAKLDLQRALVPYSLLYKDPIQVHAWMKSNTKTFYISFDGKIVCGDLPDTPSSDQTILSFSKNFMPKKD